MDNLIKMIGNPEAEKLLGVEIFNWNYRFLDCKKKNKCELRIISELKFRNDSKTKKHRITVSFAAKDADGLFAGVGKEYIYEKGDYFIKDVFTVDFECSVSKDKIKEIEVYINNK